MLEAIFKWQGIMEHKFILKGALINKKRDTTTCSPFCGETIHLKHSVKWAAKNLGTPSWKSHGMSVTAHAAASHSSGHCNAS